MRAGEATLREIVASHDPDYPVRVRDLMGELLGKLDAMRAALTTVVGERPPTSDDTGECLLCGHRPGLHPICVTDDPRDHEADCPWIRAKELLT